MLRWGSHFRKPKTRSPRWVLRGRFNKRAKGGGGVAKECLIIKNIVNQSQGSGTQTTMFEES